ncbi:MAG: hypothetical protein DHS20C18_14190 [Saprospiraceae bacterium]|nr:MAG: hypothetical protein DHS20C18_14190 [Saprospiraceae bacterium]
MQLQACCNQLLHPTELLRLEAVFESWRKQNRSFAEILIHNIFQDRFFDHSSADIARFLIKYSNEPIKVIQYLLRKESSYFRKGGNIKNEHFPGIIGTVISESLFKRFLRNHCIAEFDHEEENIDQFLSELKTYQFVPKERKHLSIKAPNRSLWFFWNYSDPKSSPFRQFLPKTKKKIISELGLGHYEEDGYDADDMFCFSFNDLSNRIGYFLYRPTWVDSDFSRFWCPPTENETRYGWTQHLCEPHFHGHRHIGQGAPEAIGISKKIRLEHLSAIEVLTK